MKATAFDVSGVDKAQRYSLDDMDRTEYIKSQMASYPDYADRIATEMFANPGKYPIFERAKIHTGFVEDAQGQSWPTFKPGELRFVGWMNGQEHAEYMVKRQAEREAVLSDG